MALDDAFQDKTDMAVQNRAQLPPIEDGGIAVGARTITARTDSPVTIDQAEWATVGLIWITLVVVLILLARWTRHDWEAIGRWTRRICIWLGSICLFGALVSVRHDEPWRVLWLATSWWPALMVLAVLAARRTLINRPTIPSRRQ